MDKVKLNYWIDILLVVCLVVVGVTGIILFFAFPYGQPHVGRFVTFLGIYKTAWIDWHSYFGIVMITLIFLHFILHFNWLKVITKKLFR